MHEIFMNKAIQLAVKNAGPAGGGPFGAVIVREGEIIGQGVNRVTLDNDPTAHAEILAIRQACAVVGDFRLIKCRIYSSCEPCPMCLGAIYWARLEGLYYGASRHDAAQAGFDDESIYRELAEPIPNRKLSCQQIIPEKAGSPFSTWASNPGRVEY